MSIQRQHFLFSYLKTLSVGPPARQSGALPTELTGRRLPLVRINRLGRALNDGKITKPTERNGAFHLQFDFSSLFSAGERLETGKFCKWSGNFRRSVSNGKREVPLKVLRNFRMEFQENYLTISVFSWPYCCYGNLLCHKINSNLFPNDWAVCWYHDFGVNRNRIIIMTHQTLSLEKYWKLLPATLNILV